MKNITSVGSLGKKVSYLLNILTTLLKDFFLPKYGVVKVVILVTNRDSFGFDFWGPPITIKPEAYFSI